MITRLSPRLAALSAALVAVLVVASFGFAQTASPALTATPEACSRTWVGHDTEIERALMASPIIRMEAVPIGVTKPQRGYLEAGGPVARFAWKALPPGRRGGFSESYKAEIAAYHLDRLLDLHMVPPVVERTVDGKLGAAVMWIEQTKGWDMSKPIQGPEPRWSRQVSRMKLFDQLIANIDRNQGNLLYDADWHLFLIDHSRAFTTRTSLDGIAVPGIIDRQLWDRIESLTPADLDRDLGAWLTDGERKAVFARRDRMRTAIARMVKDQGAAKVFLE